jgi:hypothetical protein
VCVGGDVEREEEDELSVRLQGVPANAGTATAMAMGMGMGRQRSQSAREKVRPYPRPPLQPQPHQQQDGRPGFKTVYPDVGVRGGAVAGERPMDLGRQRSHSVGEGVHSKLYPHPHPHPHPHANRLQNREWHGVSLCVE